MRVLVTGDLEGDGALEILLLDDLTVMIVPADPALIRVEEVPEFQFHFADSPDPAAFAHAVGRAATRQFNSASAWPQPLEAVLVAVTERCVPPLSADVAIIFVTTHDDCSFADPEITDPASTHYEGSPAERCQRYAESALQQLSRYASLFAGEIVRSIAFGVIAGVPADLIVASAAAYSGLSAHALDDRRLTPTPDGHGSLLSSCRTPVGTPALPPLRLLSAVRSVWGLGVKGSICADDLIPSLSPLIVWLGPSNRSRGCAPFRVQGLDLSNCQLEEGLPDDIDPSCTATPGREVSDIPMSRNRSCMVRRIDHLAQRGVVAGWWSTNGAGPSWECPNGPYFGFSRGFVHRPGASCELHCSSAATAARGSRSM